MIKRPSARPQQRRGEEVHTKLRLNARFDHMSAIMYFAPQLNYGTPLSDARTTWWNASLGERGLGG